jgi:exosome complex component RRP43
MTPLVISRSPISMSFGIFDSYANPRISFVDSQRIIFCSLYLLADPTSFEEPMLDTVISIVVGDDGELISVNQLGLGVTGSQDVLSDCMTAAKDRCGVLRKQLIRDI